METFTSIEINLDFVDDGLRLQLDAKTSDTIFDALESAEQNGEARFQILEGCFYYFTFNSENFHFSVESEQIVQAFPKNKRTGLIAPNTYVGTLQLHIVNSLTEKKSIFGIEVQSVKSSYRSDYRAMLEFITERCTDLLLQYGSPVAQYFEPDFDKDYETLYQRFSFVRSVVSTNEFSEAVHRIVTSPVSNWARTSEDIDIRRVKRISGQEIRKLAKSESRLPLDDGHYLKSYGLNAMPEKLSVSKKTDSVDTPENRFVKYVLEAILQFCTEIYNHVPAKSGLAVESEYLIGVLESQLQHSIFNEISKPATLKLNSPVLQRKEGYREILRVWLIFQLAAKLIWEGGNDVYQAGKKDVATLYEYWTFFVLLDVISDIFRIEPSDISSLLEFTTGGINLRLKQGRFTSLRGTYDSGIRTYNIRFCYNRSFGGNISYPKGGSWTTTMRPDYTLSMWPSDINEKVAETNGSLVHIHFDAKYKLANFSQFTENSSSAAATENGIYKNSDLLKMHAYKDGIRRTAAAYVLYPGSQNINYRAFHEIIPGLGAFPLNPSKTTEGITDLKFFILEIVNYLNDLSSQFIKISRKTHEIHAESPDSEKIYKGRIPGFFGLPPTWIPDETFVITSFFYNDAHRQWILNNGIYNLYFDNNKQEFVINKSIIDARYLLLFDKDTSGATLWRISGNGIKLYTGGKPEIPGISEFIDKYNWIIEVEKIADDRDMIIWNHDKVKEDLRTRNNSEVYTLTALLKLCQ